MSEINSNAHTTFVESDWVKNIFKKHKTEMIHVDLWYVLLTFSYNFSLGNVLSFKRGFR